MSSSIAEIFGVPALRKLREVAPGVHCQIDVFVAPDLLRRLQDGEIDMCIQVFQPGVWDPVADVQVFAHEALFADRYVLVGDAANELIHEGLDFDGFCAIDHIETRFAGNLASGGRQPDVRHRPQPGRPRGIAPPPAQDHRAALRDRVARTAHDLAPPQRE